jgi:hypothetical protein
MSAKRRTAAMSADLVERLIAEADARGMTTRAFTDALVIEALDHLAPPAPLTCWPADRPEVRAQGKALPWPTDAELRAMTPVNMRPDYHDHTEAR